MAYFPFYIDIENKKCLVIGGGTVACRKAEALMDYGPFITVISPVVSNRMIKDSEVSEGRIILINRGFSDEDLSGFDFVVAATADKSLNRRISRICKKLRLPVNVVDAREECSFIFPALIKDHDITVAISTGGDSPAVARYLKQQVRAAIPEGFGALAQQLGACRELVRERVGAVSVRKEIYKEMVSEGIRLGGAFTREQAERIIDRKQKEMENTYE